MTMTFKELRKASGMTQKQFSEYFGIPLRSIENWEADSKKCRPYLLDLLHYKLQKEGFVLVWE
jgi:DNA-binding transcriptional regulator YiaG